MLHRIRQAVLRSKIRPVQTTLYILLLGVLEQMPLFGDKSKSCPVPSNQRISENIFHVHVFQAVAEPSLTKKYYSKL